MNIRKTALISALAIACSAVAFGCSTQRAFFGDSHSEAFNKKDYLSSGSILLSRSIPQETTRVAKVEPTGRMAPLIGYVPPVNGFVPAENETWLKIDRKSKQISLYRGTAEVKTIQAEGVVTLGAGVYPLQHKQKRPLWYAPDEYFSKRQLKVPPNGDRLRYRRGALGEYALYPTTTFPIHAGPIWSNDVGGLKVSKADLTSIFYMLPIGATIEVIG